jgi:4-methyl-5(b-hydroxyethyl)-thiazole monophosphate biosynthesis
MNRYCVVIGEGFDDIEAITLINILRRSDIAIDVLSVNKKNISSFTKVNYITDDTFENKASNLHEEHAGILLPGGPGVQSLFNNKELLQAIARFNDLEKLIYAICGAPVILYNAGILRNTRYTCLQSVSAMIKDGKREDVNVVIDGNIITAKAMGVSAEGAFAVLGKIKTTEDAVTFKSQYYY